MSVDDKSFWEKAKELDLFIFNYILFDDQKQIAGTILPILENHTKIKVFPDQNTRWHYDDKIKQYLTAKQYGFPFVESNIFWDRTTAMQWCDTAQYPVVFKLATGASSSSVILIKKKSEAKKIIRTIFHNGFETNRLPFFM